MPKPGQMRGLQVQETISERDWVENPKIWSSEAIFWIFDTVTHLYHR